MAEPKTILAPLGQIDDNPYQTRQTYDEAGIVELAEDIQRMSAARPGTKGLIHVPVGRLMPDGRVQLGVGHRRKRAFDYLHAQHGDGWGHLPLEIADLSDEDMMAMAWSENSQREEVSAIEKALAIKRAMDEFGYSLVQLGKRWGLSKSAVSNTLRLLKLPDEVKDLVQGGDLDERHARELLPIVQVAGSKREAVKLAKETAKHGWSARIVNAQVSQAMHRLTREIDARMLDWSDWGDVVWPPAGWPYEARNCKPACRTCAHHVRGKCNQVKAYDARLETWHRRLATLAGEKADLPVVDNYEPTIPAAIVEKAKEKGCPHLAVRHTSWGNSDGVLVDESLPDVYYVCAKGRGCDCLKEKEAAEPEDPQRAALLAWQAEQAAQAGAIHLETLEKLAEAFRYALQQLAPRRVPLFVALVKRSVRWGDPPMPYDDIPKMAQTLAELTAGDSANRVGRALLRRAEVYGLARMATPIDEVEARLHILQDLIDEARLQGRKPVEWMVVAETTRIQEIFDAHLGRQDLRDEFARLQAEIAAFSQEKREPRYERLVLRKGDDDHA
jgi:ParB/RepB/Spo0J family partition protein